MTPQEVLKTGQSTAASQSVTLFRTLRSTAPMHHVSGALTGGAGACAGGTPRSGTKAALGSSADRSYSPSSGITGHQGSPATLRTASRHVDLESPFEFESPGAPNEGWHCARILSVRGSSGSLYLSSGALSAFRRSSHASAHHGARSAHFRRSATRRATLAVCPSSLRKATLRLTLRRRPRRRAKAAMRRGW